MTLKDFAEKCGWPWEEFKILEFKYVTWLVVHIFRFSMRFVLYDHIEVFEGRQ